jgi:hypothetical protein
MAQSTKFYAGPGRFERVLKIPTAEMSGSSRFRGSNPFTMFSDLC